MPKTIHSRLEQLRDLVSQMGHDDADYERWLTEIKQLEHLAKTRPQHMPAAPGKRSNKKLTNSAIQALRKYLQGTFWTKYSFWVDGNTSASREKNGDLTFKLHNRPILSIHKTEGAVSHIRVFSGGNHDRDGNPSAETRERLNGLLDALSGDKYLPDNVKVFMERESGLCYLARFNEKTVLNKNYPTRITVEMNAKDFIFHTDPEI